MFMAGEDSDSGYRISEDFVKVMAGDDFENYYKIDDNSYWWHTWGRGCNLVGGFYRCRASKCICLHLRVDLIKIYSWCNFSRPQI